jgi:dihydroneopterin aldolase
MQVGSDRITLSGLRGRGLHGVYPRERIEGQTFVVDAVLEVDTRAAAAGDDLARTADYGIAQQLVAAIEGEPVNLIETLAARLAEICLADPAVNAVQITVHKPDAPITVPFDDVSVTIRRQRTEAGTANQMTTIHPAAGTEATR